jgi:anti-sigma-K factor RskA
MNCDELQDSYELFAMGVAEDPEREEIRAHLNRGCEVCTAGMKRAIQLVAEVGSAAPSVEPSAKLRRRILASVGGDRQRSLWTPVWATAAVLLLAVAIYFGREQRSLALNVELLRRELNLQNHELVRYTEAFAILNGADSKEVNFGTAQPKPPRGRIFLNPTQGVLLMASNLPPAPSGKIYEMWTIPKGGKPVPAGLFQSQSDGSAMHIRPGSLDLEATAAVAVTVENEAGSDQPTSPAFIVAPVPATAPR